MFYPAQRSCLSAHIAHALFLLVRQWFGTIFLPPLFLVDVTALCGTLRVASSSMSVHHGQALVFLPWHRRSYKDSSCSCVVLSP